jgi:membrane protease YdiL (CAAX protease family)
MKPEGSMFPRGEFSPTVALVTFALVYLSFFLPRFFEDNYLANMLVHDLVIVAIVWLLFRYYGFTWAQMRFHRMAPTEYIFGVAAGLLVIGLHLGLFRASVAFFGEVSEGLEEIMATLRPANMGQMVVLGTEALIISSFLEEVIFRGLIFNGFRRLGFWPAALLSSILYAIFFFDPWMLLSVFAMGLVVCWVYERTGNIAVAMLAHLVANIAFFLEIAGVIQF